MKINKIHFSIIIPTYNRPEQLAQCLQSLVHQTYKHNYFEVIIVNDGSKVPLSELVLRFHDKLNITLLTQQNAGSATARNTGATQAKGKFLVFTDDDCQPKSNWLKNLAISFKENSNVAIGGKTINNLSKNIYATASQLLVDYLYSYYNFEYNQARFFTTNNFALPKKLFQAINGFDTNFPLAAAEDREFCYRWLNNGYRMIYVPKNVIYHNHQLTFLSFCKQQFNYGRGAFIFHRIKRLIGDNMVESKLFYLNLIQFPFSKVHFFKALILFILIIVSQIANTIGYFWEKSEKK